MDANRLRPRRSLFWRGTTAVLAFFVPAFGVLFFLTVPNGPWPLVLGGTVLVASAFAYSVISYNRLGVWVTPEGITERGFFGKATTVDVADIGSIVLADVFPTGTSSDTVPQLFVCDADGWQRIRLRGQFWSRESMNEIVAILDAPLNQIDRPISTSELYATYPGLLYWFERRPVIAALIFGGVLVLGGLVLYGVLVSVGATA